MEKEIIVIAHNIRSAHNVGSLLRTSEGLGVNKVILSGYSPYPFLKNDPRMPHESRKVSAQIEKTSLGAEKSLSWEYQEDIKEVFTNLKAKEFKIIALEQTAKSVKLPDYKPAQKIALLLGSEVTGVDEALLKEVDDILEIPMFGKKESFNVVQAAAMALYHCRFMG